METDSVKAMEAAVVTRWVAHLARSQALAYHSSRPAMASIG
jgi:hypothetical protein